jgi:zinc protease
VLCIVGDFEEQGARSLVEKYFAGIPSQPQPPPVDVTEPGEVARTQETFFDKLAPAPAFVLGWKIPARRTPDYYALTLAAELLFEGDSSRLYQKLVKGDESVVSIQGGVDERRGPSAWYIFALPKPGEEVAVIRQQIFDEIKDLSTSGPADSEMEKLRNSLCNDAVRGRQSTMYRAQRIAEYALYDSDPHLIDSELDQYLRITADDIKGAVSRFLDVENRVVLDIIPETLVDEHAEITAAASPQPAGEPKQPTAPAPQIPSPQRAPSAPAVRENGQAVPSQQPAEASTPNESGTGPFHP